MDNHTKDNRCFRKCRDIKPIEVKKFLCLAVVAAIFNYKNMAKTREQKKKELENLAKKIKESKSIVFGSLDKVGVKEAMSLRRDLKKQDSEMMVIKKTLLKKVIKDEGLDSVDVSGFEGNVSVVLGYKDEIAPAKILYKFKKSHESVGIFGGVLENKFIDQASVENLAKLPSREELIARVVGSLRAPVANFVGVLNGVLRSFVYVLKAVSDTKK